MGEVWLRYSVRSRRKFLALFGGLALFAPIIGGVNWVAEDGAFAEGAWFGLPVGIVVGLVGVYHVRPKYVVRGDYLTRRGNRRPGYVLPHVANVHIHRHRPRGARDDRLVITVESFRIVLADSWIASYYAPDGLHALADGLAKSPSPYAQWAAGWLRQFAVNPTHQMWPPESP